MTSHAAVVARGMGTCCVSGCGDIAIDEEKKVFSLGGKEFHEGDFISLDGSTGNIYGEAIDTVEASISGNFERLMKWADEYRVLEVRTNADTPHDAQQAAAFGAQGIGPCRTEHMLSLIHIYRCAAGFSEGRLESFPLSGQSWEAAPATWSLTRPQAAIRLRRL